MGSVTIKFSSQDQARFRKQVKNLSKVMKVRSDKVLDAAALEVQGEARSILQSQKTTDTGNLSGSITIRKTVLGGRRIGTNTGYGLYVEFGRPPGSPPPIKQWTGKTESLDAWVRRKLGLRNKAADRAARFIALKIGKTGTRAQPFLVPAFKRVTIRLTKKFRNLTK